MLVRMDVLDFHGKWDPYAFQDWLIALEDLPQMDWSLIKPKDVFCKDET
jgi:hypothetical protein